MSANVIIVPHPGSERTPRCGSNYLDWPKPESPHARKFIRSRGKWTLPGMKREPAFLEYWTEYEAPTFCENVSSSSPCPSVVQTIDDKISKGEFNTDPWIYYPGFIWSVCRHNKLGRVNEDDIVLFGSVFNHKWVLDTLMVVKERFYSQVPSHAGELFDTLFRDIVGHTIEEAYSPVVGKTPENGSIFSFSPAVVANEGHRPFPRPAIGHLFSKLRKSSNGNSPSPRNSRALVHCNYAGSPEEIWKTIVEEVQRNQLVLGTSFCHPRKLNRE